MRFLNILSLIRKLSKTFSTAQNMTNVTTFQQYLQSAFASGPWTTDEVIEFVLPLFEEVLSFHDNSKVGSFDKPDTVFLNNGRLDIDENFTHAPSSNLNAVQKLLEYQQISGYNITQRVLIDQDITQGKSEVVNLQIQPNSKEELKHPVYFPGYQCYELKVGHHDAQTDIFCLGLILGSAVMGLDLYDLEDLNQFVIYRSQPAGLNSRIHPTINALVTEMTELDRGHRRRDLAEIIQRLKFYRDYDPQREIDLSKLAMFEIKKPGDRKGFILSKLRNRLFDTTRRNRLLYYKPNTRFVNLTVSSVPIVLHYQSINPQLLFTWKNEISSQIVNQKDLSLNKYLRFEDHPYLNAQLNGIRQQSEYDKKEYGFSQLKLVVAFLHWHNLKEDIAERIQSPLLLLPVELERKKSLKEERFTLKILDNTAIINPVLSNHLKDLFGITLPESIDFDDVSMETFFELVQTKLHEAKQGVKLNYIDKPRIKIIYSIARQTINNYRKRLKLKGNTAFHQIDYSYSEDNYKPLGLELFRQKVQPKLSSLEFLLGSMPEDVQTENFSPTNAKAKGTFHLTDGENNPYSWDFDICNIVLGNFNYKKMSLVSDYNKINIENVGHPVFDELFSPHPKQPDQTNVENRPIDWYHVIFADPSQSKAVVNSRTGKSYIIQGPPGTGKSQTITNLIADFLANGKTVLFVCEKRAALDVVYHRLQQNSLAELCCYIHDSQGDKKEFIKDLKTVYDDFLKNKMDTTAIIAQRKFVLNKLLEDLDLLKVYHQQQCRASVESGINTQKLIERLLSVKANIPKLDEATIEAIPYYSEWIKFGETIGLLAKALEETGAEPQLANHPFKNLGGSLVNADSPFTLLNSFVNHSYDSIKQLSELISKHDIPPQHSSTLENIKNLIEDSHVLESLARSHNLRLVESSNPESRDFEQTFREYSQLQQSYLKALEGTKKWVKKFEKQEVEQALALAHKHEKSFFSFLNSNWRQLKKQLKQCYDFQAHQLKPAFSLVLQQLNEEYQIEEQARLAKANIEQQYKVSDIDIVHRGIESIRRKQGDAEVDFLLQHPQCNELVIKLSKLNNVLHQLEADLKQCLHDYKNKSLSQIKDEIATINSNADVLKDLLPSLRKFTELPEFLQHIIRKLPLTPIQAEAAMANKTLGLVLQNNIPFANSNYKALENIVKGIEKNYRELLKLNSDYIRSQKRQKFLDHYELSNMSTSVLTNEQKDLKKVYTEGRRILEHEMGKTMRYKSIRELASNDSGKVLKEIKPIWLMSPLSVSDSLPLSSNFFDVVIFDEASQITLEEGIPALFRAPQTIIVGDDKQMPPSNFFNAKTEDPEDLEMIEGEKEDEILSSEADSLLVQGSRKLNSTMLSWHYRSRHESLISYSNHAFYEAGLLTIPDKKSYQVDASLQEILHVDDGSKNARLLLEGGISFHYLPNSIYESRSNIHEAKYIANLVRELLINNIQDTIGIVAFSQEQQGIIEEAINNLAVMDKTFEDVLEKAYNRKDEGQFTGLFVKNLENVQGDERDIIIMSVCYGHDSNKKMLMNFGPINRKGGEKRLNVIFSRAKKHMAVISSIRHYHITNDYNDGANYFKCFLHYAECVSIGNMQLARTILDGLIANDQRKVKTTMEQSVTAKQVKESLERKGYLVNELVGQSNFKCSLAVKKKIEDPFYTLGILVDDAYHYQNHDIVEQYFLRPSILQSFGWKIANVYAKDWLENSDKILCELVNVLEEKHEPVIDEQLNKKPASNQEETQSKLLSTILFSADGQKFWEIVQQSNQVEIRSGKKDTKGQIQVKSFSNEDEARLAKEKFIEEKILEGYINAN
jgi:superfamily I DNA and/or RNA helicase/predicted DNA-binding WGR domain protein